MLGRDRDHLADRRLEPAGGGADDDRVAGDDLDAVVVEVLVRDEDEVGGDVDDRRVEPLDPPPGEALADVAERVDHDPLPPFEQERGLSEPADAHQSCGTISSKRAPRSSGS